MNPNNASYIKRMADLQNALWLMLDAFKISMDSAQLAARVNAFEVLESELKKGAKPPEPKD